MADRPPPWRLRLLVVQAAQLPAVGLALFAPPPAGPWLAALWGSAMCSIGTDSGWRWRNRLLMLQAVAWLVWAATRR